MILPIRDKNKWRAFSDDGGDGVPEKFNDRKKPRL